MLEGMYHFSELLLQWKYITEGVPGPIKEEVMKALCRDYKVDIDSS